MPGLRGHVFHINVNCSDLAASVAFYQDAVGLTPVVHTAPERPQSGDAFGLDVAQWDAWIMAGWRGLEGVVVDLLEWKVPRPTRAAGAGGFRRLRLAAPDGAGRSRRRVDPDGTPLEMVASDRAQVAGVVVACSDLEDSQAFYRDVVGLSRVAASTFCDTRGPEAFSIELTAAAAPAAPRIATDLGIYRLALLTDDLDRDHDTLVAAGVRPYSPPAHLDMGPGLPGLRALFFPDPDGTTLELIEQSGGDRVLHVDDGGNLPTATATRNVTSGRASDKPDG